MTILVSQEDEWILSAYPWQCDKNGYVFFQRYMGGKLVRILLHRVLLCAQTGEIVDHRDGNPLNNTRGNLRRCTHAQNMRNRKLNKNSSTGFKGVYVDGGKSRKFRAEIKCDGQRIRLGAFDHAADAALMYRLAAIHYHGEFARFN
jgi:hypothetical protein